MGVGPQGNGVFASRFFGAPNGRLGKGIIRLRRYHLRSWSSEATPCVFESSGSQTAPSGYAKPQERSILVMFLKRKYGSVKSLSADVCIAVGMLLFLTLGNWNWSSSWLGQIRLEILNWFQDPELQWVLVTGFVVNFLTLLAWREPMGETFRRFVFWQRPFLNGDRNCFALFAQTMLLFGMVVLTLFNYAVDYKNTNASSDCLAWMGAIFIGQVAMLLVGLRHSRMQVLFAAVLLPLMTMVCVSFFSPAGRSWVRYAGKLREAWIFKNPNVFGVIMAIACVLALSFLIWVVIKLLAKPEKNKRLLLVFGLAAPLTVLAAFQMIKSYSRGAWLGCAVGVAYLAFHLGQVLWNSGRLKIKTIRVFSYLAIIGASIFVCLSLSSSIRHPVIRRLVSAVNTKDFSSKNRIESYVNGLQVMADHPFVGTGWSGLTPVYADFYLSPKVEDGSAIHVNDFLVIGAKFGIVTLLAFAGYIWLSMRLDPLTKSNQKELLVGVLDDDTFAKVACRAAFMVSLVGVWFDGGANGGLFTFVTAVLFWVLLEVGSADFTPPMTKVVEDSPLRVRDLALTIFLLPVRGTKATGRFVSRRAQSIRNRYSALPVSVRRTVTFSLAGIAIILVVPPMEVAWMRLSNPSTTMPIVLRSARSKMYGLSREPADYQWVNLEDSSRDFLKQVWAIEDGQFFLHRGFDWKQIKLAMDESKRTGKPARGASTITQQCARSLFLWQGRSWMRKSLEAYYTFWMETFLSKKRILELYINVIELGDGVYGLESAAQRYYGKPTRQLTPQECAMLVAIMPRPREWNPMFPSENLKKRQTMILNRSKQVLLSLKLTSTKEAE